MAKKPRKSTTSRRLTARKPEPVTFTHDVVTREGTERYPLTTFNIAGGVLMLSGPDGRFVTAYSPYGWLQISQADEPAQRPADDEPPDSERLA